MFDSLFGKVAEKVAPKVGELVEEQVKEELPGLRKEAGMEIFGHAFDETVDMVISVILPVGAPLLLLWKARRILRHVKVAGWLARILRARKCNREIQRGLS